MRYMSTRGAAPALAFDEVLLAGLARDGGLYVPESWPHFDAAAIAALAGKSYPQVVAAVTFPFVAGAIDRADFDRLVGEAYAGFDHAAVAPLVQLDGSTWLMELFHGPTLSFKDYALQLLGRLLDHVLRKRGQRVTIVGATSGDTGSAAIEAVQGRSAIDVFMLHPKGRVSDVQRRQMTSVLARNVFNIAVEGNFDDCQDLVKAMFNDLAFRDEMHLTAVNSINFARIMAQIAYYFWAAVALGAPHRAVRFCVPTGNFGNVYSGYAAREMGLPIEHLQIGSNRNDILTRFFESGAMKIEGVTPSLSPSMDIQVSSNFERLLFDLYGRRGPAVAETMAGFRDKGVYEVGGNALAAARKLFSAYRLSDEQTLEMIAETRRRTGLVVDPHSAIGIAGPWRHGGKSTAPTVVLATAHPAKFPDAVEKAIGLRPALPAALADLASREERCAALPNDAAALQAYMRRHASLKGAA
ncbi:MAG: threonine synthase [Reyranellaceae bacterium]